MKKLLFTLLWISFSAMLYSQVPDTILPSNYERNICLDNSGNDYQKSVDYFIDVIKKDSADLEAYYNLGMSYYKLLNFPEAVAIYSQLIDKDSCFNYALENRAICKYFLKDIEGACLDFKKALQCSYPNMSGIKEEYEKLCK